MEKTPIKKDVDPHNITPSTQKRLFSLAHNKCSFPDCPIEIASTETYVLSAAICHIEAAEATGERFNPSMDNEARRSFDNLIVLCPTHHTITDDVDKFPVATMKKMKQDHIDKMMKLSSPGEIITRYPTALAEIVNAISSSDFLSSTDGLDTRKEFAIDEKIQHNRVIRFKPTIEEYSVYQGKLTRLYSEIEIQGSGKKTALLHHIRSLYLESKGDLVTNGTSIQDLADELMTNVESKLWDIIDKRSSNMLESLSYEDRAVAIRIVMVDAFMRCKILEEPLNHDR